MTKVVCNASPIIALSSVGLFHVLYQLFEEIMVPQAVLDEIMRDTGAVGAGQLKMALERGSVHSFQVCDNTLVEKLAGRLHHGELEVIIGAVEQAVSTVILDDRQARALANTFKLDCTGTVGVLLLAKNRRLLPEVKPYLEGLARQGFRLSDALHRKVLELAEEL
jgi:predicted nucleic acid-binding protein